MHLSHIFILQGVHGHLCRSGLKAELGAFYPLLLLRPMDAERPEPGQLAAALSALRQLCAQAQFLVRDLDLPSSASCHNRCPCNISGQKRLASLSSVR